LRSLVAWDYGFELVDHDAYDKATQQRVTSGSNANDFNPKPIDLSNMTLEKDMISVAERMAENAHNIWSKRVSFKLIF
jgi:hypothetical protein